MRERKVTLGHILEFTAWVGMSWILKALPRSGLVWLADSLGWLCYNVLRIRRKMVDEHLTIAFGATHSVAERSVIGRKSYQNSVLTFFEFLQPEGLFGGKWKAFQGITGSENLQGFTGGKPVIMVTGHIGNWEGMAGLLEEHDIWNLALAKPMHNPLVQKRILQGRAIHKRLEILLTHESMKAIVSATRHGKWVTFLADQDARRAGVFVDFFGRPASTAQGPALFSWKLGLPILPVFCVREQTGLRAMKIIICPPIMPDPAAEKDAEILRLTRLHVQALETVIKNHPEDYFWLHRRWKSKPR